MAHLYRLWQIYFRARDAMASQHPSQSAPDADTCFPKKAIFIYVNHSYVSSQLRTIVAALSYKGRQDEL